MNDPYEVLGLTTGAGEAKIRERYLELVREFPPERAPERFAVVHAAYAALRDPAARLRSMLFEDDTKHDSVESIATDLRRTLRDARLPLDILLSLADSP